MPVKHLIGQGCLFKLGAAIYQQIDIFMKVKGISLFFKGPAISACVSFEKQFVMTRANQ